MLPPKLPTRVLLLVAILLVLPLKGFAQSAAARPDRGVMPNGSYSVSDIENINLQNGNVNLEIPLASLPPIAGSKLSWTIKANYNSKVWNMLRTQQDAGGQTWAPYVVSHPSADGGWVIGGSHTMIFRNAMEDFQRLPYPTYSGLSQSELNLLNNNDWWKVVLRMPDGSEHEFRPTDYSPYSGSQEFLKGFFNVIPNGTPIRYYSVDGT